MTKLAEHSDLEALFLFYNRLHRDMERRLKPLGLTLTGLQALMGITRLQGTPVCTRARLAEQLGLTNGSMSVLIGRLTRLGYVEPSAFQLGFKAIQLRLTPKGQKAMHSGLVGWDDVADVWFSDMPTKRSNDLFNALAALNGGYNQRALDERADKYLKSLRLHETRKRVLADRGKPRKRTKTT
ncbi:MarR family winged helix-turn-helix transcriptional regulator [Pseudoxanthomonas mexicana]|uniref:MarR family winged helix-turn-helix transcriptional regulator n=1 Tax=Pseudoxanthomonas mexicana TaxID=128785 RepID=UPI00289C0AF1|nr:MarR family winged helix-turn-helix transcriptional regulator [Pseudoxanthomonas mexicana]